MHSVSVVAVGGGAGGTINNQVNGTAGVDSYFIDPSVVLGGGGAPFLISYGDYFPAGAAAVYTGDGGGRGGLPNAKGGGACRPALG